MDHAELYAAVRRGRVCGRRADRPASGHPRRRSPRFLVGHRARRLVQRPSRLPSPCRSISCQASGSRGRPWERGTGCRAHPRPQARRELASTETTEPALEALARVRCARCAWSAGAGPAQAKFTHRNWPSSGSLPALTSSVTRAELEMDSTSQPRAGGPARQDRRNVDVLRGFSARELAAMPRAVRIPFCVSPVRLEGTKKSKPWSWSGLDPKRTRPGGGERLPPRSVKLSRVESSSAALATRCCVAGHVLSTHAQRPCPSRNGRIVDESGVPNAGPLLRRLDQARPDRRHRHQQEGRHRDGGPAARRRRDRLRPAD